MRSASTTRPVNDEGRAADADWWRQAVVYQIYPRSFADSDGNGLGDLAGVISRIPYLAALGIDAVWLSPFYPSALADGGTTSTTTAPWTRGSARWPTLTR